jgi:hypothetical protein
MEIYHPKMRTPTKELQGLANKTITIFKDEIKPRIKAADDLFSIVVFRINQFAELFFRLIEKQTSIKLPKYSLQTDCPFMPLAN